MYCWARFIGFGLSDGFGFSRFSGFDKALGFDFIRESLVKSFLFGLRGECSARFEGVVKVSVDFNAIWFIGVIL